MQVHVYFNIFAFFGNRIHACLTQVACLTEVAIKTCFTVYGEKERVSERRLQSPNQCIDYTETESRFKGISDKKVWVGVRLATPGFVV